MTILVQVKCIHRNNDHQLLFFSINILELYEEIGDADCCVKIDIFVTMKVKNIYVSVVGAPRGHGVYELQDHVDDFVAEKSERGPSLQRLWALPETA